MFPFWMPNQIAALTLWFICLVTIPKLVTIPVRGHLWVCLVGWNYEAQIKPGSYLLFFNWCIVLFVFLLMNKEVMILVKRGNYRDSRHFPLETYLISSGCLSLFGLIIIVLLLSKLLKVQTNVYSSWLLLGVEIFGNPEKFHSLLTWCEVSPRCCFFFFLFLILLVSSSVISLNCMKRIRRQDAQCYVSEKFRDSR